MEATVRKPPLQFPSSFIPSKPAGSGRQRTSKDQRFTSPLFLLAGCLEQKDVGFLLIKPLFGHLQEPGECPYQSHQGMACSRWHDGCLVLPSSQGPGRKTKRTFHVRVGQSTAVQIIEEMHHRRFLEIGQCPFNRPVIGGKVLLKSTLPACQGLDHHLLSTQKRLMQFKGIALDEELVTPTIYASSVVLSFLREVSSFSKRQPKGCLAPFVCPMERLDDPFLHCPH